MSYSERIKQFREARKLTHQQFADAVGVSRGAIQQWESGATAPKRPNQPIVAKFMGISVSDLMSDTTSTAPAQLPISIPNKATSTAISNQVATNLGVSLLENLRGLAECLEGMDDSDRKAAIAMLGRLAKEPQSYAKVAAQIEIMRGTAFAPQLRKQA